MLWNKPLSLLRVSGCYFQKCPFVLAAYAGIDYISVVSAVPWPFPCPSAPHISSATLLCCWGQQNLTLLMTRLMSKLLPSSVTWQKVNAVKLLSCFWCFSMNLTWRDMQHLVVRTSLPGHLIAGDWKTNGVGRIGIYWLFSVIQIKHRWYLIIGDYFYPSLLHVYMSFLYKEKSIKSPKHITCLAITISLCRAKALQSL